MAKDSYISPVSIGAKIKKIRNYRGMTQTELGTACGFTEKSAAPRIRQYECNNKTPRFPIIQALSKALDIDETVLYDADLHVKNRAYHALFDIEDMHGLHPVKINNNYYLEFSGSTRTGKQNVNEYNFLKLWYETREKYLPDESDTKEARLEKEKAYDLWRYEYPQSEARKRKQLMDLMMEKERLEREIRDLNDQLNNDPTPDAAE